MYTREIDYVYKHTQAGIFWSLDERFENTEKHTDLLLRKLLLASKLFSYHLEKITGTDKT